MEGVESPSNAFTRSGNGITWVFNATCVNSSSCLDLEVWPGLNSFLRA